MEAHDAAVAAAAARVRHFHQQQKPFRIYHGSTNGTHISQRSADNTVDTSGFTRILHVDEAKKTALVEPNVSMGALVEATLKHGLVPLVVPEFPAITVGGAFSGSCGESSSFRHGSFEATIQLIEVILATGEVTRASKTEKPDLFWGTASGFGTLSGPVTLLEVQLTDAKRYVELTYHFCKPVDVAAKTQEEMTKETNDYIDGIIFSPKAAVILTGCLVDAIPASKTPVQLLRSRDPWFYTHAQQMLKILEKNSSETTITEYIPLVDYLFRYDRGGFWAARHAFSYFLMPFNRITRFILDPLLHTRVMYRALHKSGLSKFHIVQDVAVPFDRVDEFRLWLDRNLNIYPLWLCPLRPRRESPDSSHGLLSQFGLRDPPAPDILNFGVWGPFCRSRQEIVKQNRALEQEVHNLGGTKWLYAQAYYTEDEFWANYDRKSYEALRAKYEATYLLSVYDKVRVDWEGEEAAARAPRTARMRTSLKGIWPLRGLYGVYSAISGREYLLQKKSGQTPKAK